jgi:hypothetical protein
MLFKNSLIDEETAGSACDPSSDSTDIDSSPDAEYNTEDDEINPPVRQLRSWQRNYLQLR